MMKKLNMKKRKIKKMNEGKVEMKIIDRKIKLMDWKMKKEVFEKKKLQTN